LIRCAALYHHPSCLVFGNDQAITQIRAKALLIGLYHLAKFLHSGPLCLCFLGAFLRAFLRASSSPKRAIPSQSCPAVSFDAFFREDCLLRSFPFPPPVVGPRSRNFQKRDRKTHDIPLLFLLALRAVHSSCTIVVVAGPWIWLFGGGPKNPRSRHLPTSLKGSECETQPSGVPFLVCQENVTVSTPRVLTTQKSNTLGTE
jgi:hypothetical protein